MSEQNIKQILLNRISVKRIAQSSRMSSTTQAEVKRKFTNLLADEVVFNIQPHPTKNDHYVAAIDVSKTRGFKMTNQSFITGEIFDVVEPRAYVITTDEEVVKIVKPGLYISNESGTIYLVIGEETEDSNIFEFLGYTFESDEIEITETKVSVTATVAKGEIAVVPANTEDSQLGKLTIETDAAEINIAKPAQFKVKLVDNNGEPLSGETITVTSSSLAANVLSGEVTTGEDGTAISEVEAVKPGETKVTAYFGLYMKAPSVELPVNVIPPTYNISEFAITPSAVDINNPPETQPTLSLSVIDADGKPAEGILVIVKQGETQLELTSDAEGKASTVLNADAVGEFTYVGTVDDSTESATLTVTNSKIVATTVMSKTDGGAATTAFVSGDKLFVTTKVVDYAGKPKADVSVTFKLTGQQDTALKTGADGVATRQFDMKTAGKVTATTVVGDQTTSNELTITANPATAVLAAEKVTADVATFAAGGKAVIKAVVVDANNNPVSGQAVTCTNNAGDGTTSANTDATGTATFNFAPTAAGNKNADIAFKGTKVKTLTFTVTADTASPTVAANSLAVSANSVVEGGTVDASLTVKDKYGNALKGVDVVFSGGDANVTGKSNAAGLAKATLTLSTVGSATIGAKIGANAVGGTKAVTVTAKPAEEDPVEGV